jgi:thioredoxin reductase (NADPH)
MGMMDVLIVGAGPAGLTAGLYTSRSGLSTVIYEKGFPGGLANVTDRIDNYPGFPEGISGIELGERMHKQATRFGARVITAEVDVLRKEGEAVTASIGDDRIIARSAIVATGSTPRQVGVPGEIQPGRDQSES